MSSGDGSDPLGATAKQRPDRPLDSDSTQPQLSGAASPTAIVGDKPLVSGDKVGRYVIESYVGRGGMGVVYRARDPELDRMLAIKLVRSRHGGDRMLREAQAMARLDHPNVVPVFDVGMFGEQLYLVMPFLAGGTLRAWCREGQRTWRDVLARYLEAGRGLEAAHRAGIIHRDFKPDNVMIGNRGEVQVADFGLARAHGSVDTPGSTPATGPLAADLTIAGDVLGTPVYMAPEQLAGASVDARADQFSFCIALHEGLYGARPFDVPPDTTLAELRAILATDRVRPASADRQVPRWLRDAVLRGLRHAPEARWPSLGALLDAIERGLRGPRRRRLAASALTGVALVAAGVWWMVPRGTSHVPAGLAARQLTFRGDIGTAALSPDGARVAAIADRDLVLVPVVPGAELRVLLPDTDGVRSIAWSPDGHSLLATSPTTPDRSTARIIDVATGRVETVDAAMFARAVLVGPREVASVSGSVPAIWFTNLDRSDLGRRCDIPGAFEFVHSLEARGRALFVTVENADHTFTVLRTDRDCAAPKLVADRISDESPAVDNDGSHLRFLRTVNGIDIIESVDVEAGTVSRSPALPSDVRLLVGHRREGGYVATTQRQSWRLSRISLAPSGTTLAIGSLKTVAAGSTGAFLTPSPDGTKVARIDDQGPEFAALRVVPLTSLEARPPALADHVAGVAWSPDGSRLAAVITREERSQLIDIDTATGNVRSLPHVDVSSSAQLAWLDDHRIAYLRADNSTFDWIDRESGQTGELFDHTLGWTFELAVDRIHGTLAVWWARAGATGVYVGTPGQTPTLAVPTVEGNFHLAWSPDGSALWISSLEHGTIDRYTPATGKTERIYDTPLETGTQLGMAVPLAGGGGLIRTIRMTTDLVVLE